MAVILLVDVPSIPDENNKLLKFFCQVMGSDGGIGSYDGCLTWFNYTDKRWHAAKLIAGWIWEPIKMIVVPWYTIYKEAVMGASMSVSWLQYVC